MAEVKMSLKEYDAMKEELEFLKKVIAELTTPSAEPWNYDYCMEHGGSMILRSSISENTREFLESQVMSHVPKKFRMSTHKLTPKFSDTEVASLEVIKSENSAAASESDE